MIEILFEKKFIFFTFNLYRFKVQPDCIDKYQDKVDDRWFVSKEVEDVEENTVRK